MQSTTSQPMTRRTFLKSAGFAVGALTLAACAAPPAAPAAPASSDGADTSPAAETVTIKFLGGPWSFLPALDEVIDTFAAQWGSENNVNIEFERDAQVLPKIQTAIETGTGANIIQYSSPPQIFANALVDVTDIIQELEDEGGDYVPAGPYQMTSDGKWLGVPIGQHNWFINYRQDWFQEEGYDVFPDTWEEALVVGKLLKDKGRPYGMTFSDQAGGDGNGVPR
ncbi:MAG: ABC transporter substrate-binding protein, partial [Caldilineaceae bacterium]